MLRYSRKRLEGVLTEIGRLEHSEFPYESAEAALYCLRQRFEGHLGYLHVMDGETDTATLLTNCAEVLRDTFRYLPRLGFILRSTNVRNAFELYGPLRRLAAQLLGPDVSLVLSSEWEYSPFVYRPAPALPRYAFIGLPATESDNGLLVPLAGHELGHQLWAAKAMGAWAMTESQARVFEAIEADWDTYHGHFPQVPSPADLRHSIFAPDTYRHAHVWCVRQLEEAYCDAVGVRLFGLPYLYAFAYLLSPGPSGSRLPNYPPRPTRIDVMLAAAREFGLSPPPSYGDLFQGEDRPRDLTRGDEFQLTLADGAFSALVNELSPKVAEAVDAAPMPVPRPEEAGAVLDRFRALVPAEDCTGLPQIMNAAWMAFHDENLWADSPTVAPRRDAVLNDIVLKTIEVHEFEQVVGTGHAEV